MKDVTFGGGKITIDDIVLISQKNCRLALEKGADFKALINEGADFLDATIAQKGGIYGVTTGYGDSCTKTVPDGTYYELPVNLSRFHGCGLGAYFDAETTRAILAVRLASLCQGFSGVSYALLEAVFNLLQHDILPLIPQEGSVGASGDLTPLSYIAGALIGERTVLYDGKQMSSLDAFAECGLKPLILRPKEALAIMNGTAVMTAIAAINADSAKYLADISCRITALASIALRGNIYHFDERLFAVKPHQGQMYAAKRVYENFNQKPYTDVFPEKIQDQYSIRCAPHIIGVFYDFEPLMRAIIETEINSANDNPIVSPKDNSIFHGGHFYGGHIAFVMDSLKNIMANIADLLDRQMALLVDEKFNRGLPPNLSGSNNYSLHHGFKAVQIGVSAWTAECLKNTMPASVFSRSTECHNQDKVSMGTIAARDCTRVLELTRQVTAALLIACYQAVTLRKQHGGLVPEQTKNIDALLAQIGKNFEFLSIDRPLEADLRACIQRIKEKYWSVRP